MAYEEWMLPQAATTAPAPAVEPLAPPVPLNAYQGMMQPQEQDPLAPIRVPASTPQEVEVRKQGWQQVAQSVLSNPNFTRALGMFGTAALQPRQYGQSNLGHLAQAMNIGQTAYGFGEQAEYERRMQMTKEQREAEEARSVLTHRAAQTEGLGAQTEQTREAITKARRENVIGAATVDDAIAKVKTERQQAEANLTSTTTKNERDQIQLEHDKRVNELERSMPAEMREAFRDKLRSQGLENKLKVAQAASASASAGYASARAEQERQETADIRSLTPEERKQRLLGGTRGGAGSAQVQVAEMYDKTWAAANPRIMAETEEAYAMRRARAKEKFMSTVKDKPEVERFFKEYLPNVPPGQMNLPMETHWRNFQKLMGTIGGEQGTSATSATTRGGEVFVRDPKTGRLVPAPASPQ